MAEREMGDRVTGSKTGDRETRRQGDMQGNGRQVIDNILSLWPNTFKLLLGLFLHRLPLQMRSQLANFPATSPAQLAAEAIWTQSGGQVRAPKVTVAAAIASWPRLPSPCATEAGRLSLVRWWVGLPGNRGPCSNTPGSNGLCFYHAKYGTKAYQCRSCCLWTPRN